MKFPPFIISVVAIMAALPSIYAGGKPSPTPTPHFGMTIISSINDNQIITETSRSRKVYKITDRTIFYYLGQKASASDLAPGMRVSITPKFGDAGTAAVVDVGDMSKSLIPKK